ncbi:hypothetical protein B0H34DRAFT_700335 [Crassisporium funariophilum]|nr:hypothetical protein B0H34DRAFT_700335 [Crassisporium funariophilum]
MFELEEERKILEVLGYDFVRFIGINGIEHSCEEVHHGTPLGFANIELFQVSYKPHKIEHSLPTERRRNVAFTCVRNVPIHKGHCFERGSGIFTPTLAHISVYWCSRRRSLGRLGNRVDWVDVVIARVVPVIRVGGVVHNPKLKVFTEIPLI